MLDHVFVTRVVIFVALMLAAGCVLFAIVVRA